MAKDELGKTQRDILFCLFLVSHQLDKDCEVFLRKARTEKSINQKSFYDYMAKRSLSSKVAITFYYMGFKSKTARKRAYRALYALDGKYIQIIRKNGSKTGATYIDVEITKKGREYMGIPNNYKVRYLMDKKKGKRIPMILDYIHRTLIDHAKPNS